MKVATILLISTLCLTNGKNIKFGNDPGQANTICAEPESDGVLVAHENCNQFYKCAQGEPVAIDCPGNLLYNPDKEYCDWPESVECDERIIPQPVDSDSSSVGPGTGSNPDEAPEICAKPESDGVLVAHKNCNQFYKCSEGEPVALDCPKNLLYNPLKEYCDWPENVKCGERIIPEADDSDSDNDNGPGLDSNPDEAPEICAKPESDGVLVAHKNCNQFYKCSEGEPVALDCPKNLLYNPLKEYCDWPENVKCGERIIPEADDSDSDNDNGPGLDSNPDEAPEICAKPESDGVLVAHKNCNQFYKCSDRVPVALYCPGNLLYNPDKQFCDWPESVECGERINCARPGSDGILVPHENCNQFYKCSEGKPVVFDCPENLLYNPVKEYCDWPINVNCGNRIN